MRKIIFFVFAIVIALNTKAQLSNDDCINAIPITIAADGTGCAIGTTVNAIPTNFTGHACWPLLQDIPDVWYTYIATGDQNIVTVTPNGGGPAQQVAVSLTNQPCGSGALSTCDVANTNGAAATVNFIYGVGTQVWINIGSIVAEGGFQVCVSSTTPPAAPGGTCPTATVLCDKNPFSLNTFPGNVTALQPSCFGNSFQDPVFYQFTCGQSGTCEWTANPQGNFTELDWVMYDITTGCPNNATPELACNFFYAGDNGSPAGMSSTVATAACPITNGVGPATFEYCTPANLVAGRKYLIIIDNYSAISGEDDGFDMSFGGGFTIAPTSQFTATPLTSCAPPANVTFNNTSTTAVTYNWNFGNGNTSTAAAPGGQTYTAPGVYLVSLAATSNTGCVDISTQTITIGTPPVITVPTNTTVCAGATIPAAVFTTVPVGATFTWTNSNTAIGLAATGNANIDAFTATNTTTAPITATITVTPTLNGCVGAAASYTITVDPSPTLTAVTSQTICANANTTAITYAVAPAASTIDWTNSNTAIGLGASGTGDIASFTGTNAGSTVISGNFVATPTFNGCPGTPRTFTITINPIPSIPAVTSQTVCATANTTAINFNPTPAGATVNWTNSNGTIGVGVTGTGNIAAFAGINAGSTAVQGNFVATPTLSGCTGTAQNFTITVNPTPTLAAITSQTVCANANTTTITFNPTPATATVNWTNSNGTIGVGTTGTGTIAAFAGVNAGSTTVTGNFAATPTENGCTGTAQNFTITVNPIPSIPAVTSQTVCANVNTTTINFNPTPATATVNWTNSNGTIGVGTTGAGNITAFAGINAGSSPVTGNFVATPTENGCTGTAQNFTITVNHIPSIPAVTSQTVCATANTTAINFNPTPATATVNWTNSNGTIGVGTTGAGTIAAFAGVNAGSTPATGNFVATPTENGCTGTAQNFTITINPTPTLAAVTSQTVCANANTTAITFNPTPATATVNWTNSNGAIGVGTSGTGNIAAFAGVNATTNIASGNFSATPTENGCTGTAQNFTITVNPLPSLSPISSQTICPGSNTSAITFTSTPPGATVAWTNSNATIGIGANGNGNIAAFTGINAGASNLTGNFTATPTLNTCVGTAQNFSITVSQLPIATIGSNSPVCVNGTLDLSSGGGTIYSWQGPNLFSSATQNPSLANASLSMAGTYTVTVGVGGTCQSTATITVVINPLPVVNIGSNTPVCENGTINLTSGGGVSYSWLGPVAFSSNTQNPTLTPATIPMAGNYTVTVTDANNCVNANVTSVVVNPLPIGPITAPVTYCQQDTPIALSAGTMAGGSLNWYGTNATGGTASSTAPTPTTTSSGITTYYVSQTAIGCEGPRSPLDVTVNPLPTASLGPVTGGCAPICRDFVVTSTSNIVTYVWNMGNGTANTTAPTLTHCYNDAGTFSIGLLVTDNLGCANNFSFPSWVNVFENPTANFFYNPMPVTILEPSVTFNDNSIGSNIMNYSWSLGDPLNSIASGQQVEFTYLTAGIYNVQLAIMTINGCVDTIYKPVEVLEDFTVYIPNAFSPNGDGINEEFYPMGVGISNEKYSFQIFDRWGELIFSTTKLDTHWDGKRLGYDNIVQQDTYIYKLSCRSFKGDKFSKSGHVNVIR
jgi:gliding motility-associated-like protein